MMKIKIITGCILTVCILLIIPSVPAVQYNTLVETNKSQMKENIKTLAANEFKQKFNDIFAKELRTSLQKSLLPGIIIIVIINFLLQISAGAIYFGADFIAWVAFLAYIPFAILYVIGVTLGIWPTFPSIPG